MYLKAENTLRFYRVFQSQKVFSKYEHSVDHECNFIFGNRFATTNE
jgi:hypothetical protein